MKTCRRCADAGHAIVPGAVFRGRASSQVLLVGQAPGPTETVVKRPFNAGSGRRLFQWLTEAGWDEDEFRENHYMTAVTKCYPGRSTTGKGDRVPGREEQELCRPFLDQEVKFVDPRLVLLVGKLAIGLVFPKSAKLADLIGTGLYLQTRDPLTLIPALRAIGSIVDQYDGQNEGRFIVPLPHPSGASLWPNKPENKERIRRAMELLSDVRQAWTL